MNRPLAPPVTALERLVAAGLIGAAACSSGASAGSPTGSLEVDWIGADTGKLSAPAVAEWCEGLKLLELRAIQGDTGIALVLYPPDSGPPGDSVPPADSVPPPDSVAPPDSLAPAAAVAPGPYPVVPPERADSSRPSAAVALRWFAETSIRGFRGDSGRVVLEATASGTSAGRFSAHLRSAAEGSRLTVTGSFQGLSIRIAPKSCVGRPAQEADEDEDLDLYEESDVPPESAD